MLTNEETAIWLEEFSVISKQMAEDIRIGNGPEDPYIKVYWLRKMLSRLVAQRGSGSPKTAQMRRVWTHYLALLEEVEVFVSIWDELLAEEDDEDGFTEEKLKSLGYPTGAAVWDVMTRLYERSVDEDIAAVQYRSLLRAMKESWEKP